ncbi:MAG: ABC transporter substrate-binding protein [Patescibacteria group bacterium]|jgi:peptide/nickel transport system substrate-binding protein
MDILHRLFLYITSFVLSVYPSTKFVEGVVGQPQSFLPGYAISDTDKTISNLIYRGLFKYDIYGVLQPDLAESWEIDSEGIVYTVKLKEDQFWSDGSKITSDDLIYTAFNSTDLQGVGTDKVDELTVRYILPNKYSPFLNMLTVGVMPDGSKEMDPLRPVTSGPFNLLETEKSGPIVQQVLLYNTNSNERIKKLVFRYYSNEEELVIAARLGEIDGFVSSQQLDLESFKTYKYPMQGVYYAVYFNLENKKLGDVKFREKLQSVLPIRNLVEDKGILVEGPISRSLFTDKALEFDKYDKDHFPEAYNESLTLTVPDIEAHVVMARKIKDIWEAQLGIDVYIKTVSPDRFTEDIIKPKDFEVLFYGQEVGRDPDRYINWHSTQKQFPGLNISGFEQVRADRALEEGRNELDSKMRVVHYNEFQEVILGNVPAIFLYHPFINYYVDEKVVGIGDKTTFNRVDRFSDFGNWSLIRVN